MYKSEFITPINLNLKAVISHGNNSATYNFRMIIPPSTHFLETYRVVFCINSILNTSAIADSLVLQSGLDAVLDYPVILENKSVSHNYDFYVADLRGTTVRKFLDVLSKYELSNPKARYIFIAEDMDQVDVTELVKNYYLNFVVLDPKTVDFYTGFPYISGNFREFSTDLQRIGSCRNESYSLNQSYSVFPDKLPRVWRRCSLNLLYSYEAPYSMSAEGQKRGIEIDLVQIILDRIGMDGVYVNKNDDVANLIFLLLEKGNYDILFGNLPMTESDSDDLTVPYTCDSAYWYVPQSRIKPKWKLALMVFSPGANIAIIISMLSLCVLWEAVHFLMENKKLGRGFPEKCWRVTMVSLEQGVRLQTNYVTLGILFFLLLQSLLILNSLFKAKYTFFLSGTNYEKTIETIEEAMEQGLKIGSTKFLINFYLSTSDKSQYVQENFVECDTGPTCMNRSAVLKDLAILKPRKKVAYIRDSFTDDQGHYLHHRLASSVLTICNTFHLPKGHPMFPLVNRYVYFLIQHGFVQRIMDKYDQIVKSKRRSTALRNPRLKLDSVQGPVFLVVIGNAIATVAFAVEKVIHVKPKNM